MKYNNQELPENLTIIINWFKSAKWSFGIITILRITSGYRLSRCELIKRYVLEDQKSNCTVAVYMKV